MFLPGFKFYVIVLIIIFVLILLLSSIGTIYEKEVLSYFGKDKQVLAIYSIALFGGFFVVLAHVIFVLVLRHLVPKILSQLIPGGSGNIYLQKVYVFFTSPSVEYFICILSFLSVILALSAFLDFRGQ